MTSQHQEKILIIGASGFVGKVLTEELLKISQNITLVSRRQIVDFPEARKLYGDLENPTFCEEILKNIDTVYYLAAYKKNIAFHTTEPFETITKNVRPFLTFLETVKKSSAKDIVYLSSTNAEYAMDKDESQDGYVYGKYINEIIAKAFAIETKLQVKIIRSSAVYGPGDNLDPTTANFIPAMIRRVDEAKDELSVWGSGERKLQFIFVHDLVKNIIAAGASNEHFFVFGNPHVVSVNEIVEKIMGLIGKNLKISHDMSKPDKPTKLAEFKNLVAPETDIDSGLQKTIDYYKHHA